MKKDLIILIIKMIILSIVAFLAGFFIMKIIDNRYANKIYVLIYLLSITLFIKRR